MCAHFFPPFPKCLKFLGQLLLNKKIILYLLVYHVNLSSKAHPVSQHLFPDNSLAVQSRLPISAHFSWASLKFVWKHCLGRIQFCPSLLQQLTAPVGWWRVIRLDHLLKLLNNDIYIHMNSVHIGTCLRWWWTLYGWRIGAISWASIS